MIFFFDEVKTNKIRIEKAKKGKNLNARKAFKTRVVAKRN